MATKKVENTRVGYLACLIHATLYSLPFLLITDADSFAIIFGTHFLIDKYRLAVYVIRLKNWEWKSNNFGYADNVPVWLSLWLMIITDNILHIICNYIAIIL